MRRSRTNLGARRIIDDFRRKLVEWRKTFAPQVPDPPTAMLMEPVALDEQYCRDLLREVPGIVERTQRLAHLSLSGVSGESFVYLREAANCYILGLCQAAVALARAAVEVPLRDAARQAVRRHLGGGTWVLRTAERPRSTGEAPQSWQHRLCPQDPHCRHKVLHEEPTTASEALEVVEAARAVVLELTRKAG